MTDYSQSKDRASRKLGVGTIDVPIHYTAHIFPAQFDAILKLAKEEGLGDDEIFGTPTDIEVVKRYLIAHGIALSGFYYLQHKRHDNDYGERQRPKSET